MVSMKIGVYLHNNVPESGGGFTLQDDVFRALLQLSSETKHSFVILGWGEHPQAFAGHSGSLQFVDLTSFRRKAVEKRIRIKLSRGYNRIASELPGLPVLRLGRSTWIEQLVANIGIDILWNVTHAGIHPGNTPFICTVFDLQHRLQPWFPEVSAHGTWGWQNREDHFRHLSRAAFIIVGTEAGRSEVANFYKIPRERIKIVPHPTPDFALREGGRARGEDDQDVLDQYNIPSGYLLYPAQFWSHKNHVNLLLASRHLRDTHGIRYPLVFVGSDRGNESYVKRVAKELDLDSDTHFLGFVSRKDLVCLYRNAFALTYLTFFGPENLPPLEAFALKCPVIASKVSGAQEQLGDAAILVDPKDVPQIAETIKRLGDDPALRQSLITRGTARASNWTAIDFVMKVLSILDEFEPVRRCWPMEDVSVIC